MQPLIRLRMLGSQLNDAEMRKVINAILKRYGNEKILSLLFNHYLFKYQQSGEHHAELSDVNGLISNILNVRKRVDNDSNEEEQERTPIDINSMPSALIGECASYLHAKYYVRFSHCNRKTYTTCYSPSRLVSISHSGRKKQCNLNQFPSLRSLSINVKEFNEYMQSHPNHKKFHRLQRLDVANYKGNQADIEKFLKHKCFDFENITVLKCKTFGHNTRYDFDAFIDFLSHFSNVTNLSLEYLVLTDFNDQNVKISKLFPNLSVLSSRGWQSRLSQDLLSGKLLNLRSEQLVSICCDSRKFPKITCPLLKELYLVRPLKNDEQFKNVLANIKKLQRVSIGYDPAFDEQFKKLTMKLFASRHLEYVSLRSGSIESMRKVMTSAEYAIFTTKHISKKSLVLNLGNLFLASNSDQQQFVNLDLPRLVNALDASKIQNFMIKIEEISLNDEDDDMIDYIGSMGKKWKDSHLFHSVVRLFDEYEIAISNKGCSINGYSPRWLLQR